MFLGRTSLKVLLFLVVVINTTYKYVTRSVNLLQITNLLGEIVTYNKVMCYTRFCQHDFYTFFVKYVYFRAVLGMGDIKDEEKVGFHD